MPMTWNETNDAKLLVGILTTTNVKLDMHALANFMGPGCTVSAVQHRIQRLKDKVSSTSTPGGTASSPATGTTMTSPGNEKPTTPTPATPEKRKRGRPRKNPVAGGGEASTSSTTNTVAAAAGAAKKPKAKRAKKVDGTATATAAVVKNEEVSDDDEEEVLSELGVPETPGVEEGGVGEGEEKEHA
ncbi:hypothetical protein BO83DRAFT_1194 [Aspergillus eucalypticola CBS 122712]|uniref:AT hook motif protein n=1 Tax=Aspergillus eucalypticola (strain CBS 122712 / IBT 29274) TaxID=1448314 RepID=A0A317WGN5_ASPEC|nr:uncharacterized protein BO83DRAFT_1194 [Aspergillus eucalypticola CBS 122712]PWY85165.1 hypothetical protein BO83DRAFT_1194 [Aspergillus eucalypticola CBS 122712]